MSNYSGNDATAPVAGGVIMGGIHTMIKLGVSAETIFYAAIGGITGFVIHAALKGFGVDIIIKEKAAGLKEKIKQQISKIYVKK